MSGNYLKAPNYWRYLGATVPGSSHLRQGLPNQDSLGCNLNQEQSQEACLAAVSDGHGSARCFRSDRGSQFAIAAFLEVLEAFLAGQYGNDLSLIKRTAEERLPQQITRLWQEKVQADLLLDPVSPAQWAHLEQILEPQQIESLHKNPLLIYGATLLGVAITPAFILYLQLGDGEIISVDSQGESQTALPEDARLIANETTSLCQSDAWREFRFRFQVLADLPPVMLLLTTDGYVNSFRDQAGFLQVGSDLLDLLKTEGSTYVSSQLPDWLSQASAEGSGDDCTLILLWNPLLLADYQALPEEDLAQENKGASHE